MSKKRLMILGALLVLAVILILVGNLFSKKDEVSPISTIKVENHGDEKKKSDDSKNAGQLGDLGPLPDAKKMQKLRKEAFNNIEISKDSFGNMMEKLSHKVIDFNITMPTADLDRLVVKEEDKNMIQSIAFYYVTPEIQAHVFSINSYSLVVWDEDESIHAEPILGRTPIRVVTWRKAGDIPFEEGTKDYKNYMYFVNKIPQYISTFEFTVK
ncbi:hypothetical protein A374_02229 [Fictibacillus macauensis ZFHKF-1]|uniref:Uncharacterized protein n=1 Tax=Fictibacillus macauensis ZFHKF-1 TaxID=1196324 RepID=I8UJP3_9BACL|nr:hypothetical protein [Fictibacillus macauensis]EIT87033.1 hypothetical protein A374_02229 [Fictibacillus macauensis ZFHKF-1]